MTELLPLLSAALLAGLLGSAHCLGMCAGISGLFAVNSEIASFRAQLPFGLAYNLGRGLQLRDSRRYRRHVRQCHRESLAGPCRCPATAERCPHHSRWAQSRIR